MNLKKWTVITSKFVGTGPSSYEKRIYWAAVSQRLRNTEREHCNIPTMLTQKTSAQYIRLLHKFLVQKSSSRTVGNGQWISLLEYEAMPILFRKS